jgi:hypothetical protein
MDIAMRCSRIVVIYESPALEHSDQRPRLVTSEGLDYL